MYEFIRNDEGKPDLLFLESYIKTKFVDCSVEYVDDSLVVTTILGDIRFIVEGSKLIVYTNMHDKELFNLLRPIGYLFVGKE